jgi:hypothetical protein
MKLMFRGLMGLAAIALEAGSAMAAAPEPYNDAFFVRPHATAQAMLQDRADCRTQALHMSDTAASYSNPQYGALSAMGSALDEDALHDGGLHKRLQQAVFNDCMKQKGWTEADPTSTEIRELKASQHHPELLDAWLKAHEPAEPPPAPPATPAPPAPTAQTVKASAPAAATAPAVKAAN